MQDKLNITIEDSIIDETVKIFNDATVVKSDIKPNCSVGNDTSIIRCKLDNNVVINRRSYINDSYIGMYTYAGINTTINWTKIGKFCSIARNVDIGGFDHDYHKITTMPEFRFNQTNNGGGKLQKIDDHSSDYCCIGNDVWIAAGAQILYKVKIGDGAVIGGGAVVTHDVPPYAIVAGVPARIIGYRCAETLIDELLKIKWWDWPLDIIKNHMEFFMKNDITNDSINEMKKIYKNKVEIKNKGD